MIEITLLVLVLVVMLILVQSIKIAGESERFAVLTLGRFHAYSGPGLIVIIPYTQRAFRLRVGDVGELVSSEFARFGELDIPVKNVGSLRPGQAVKIDGFDGVEPQLAASAVPVKTMCPNCGHQF